MSSRLACAGGALLAGVALAGTRAAAAPALGVSLTGTPSLTISVPLPQLPPVQVPPVEASLPSTSVSAAGVELTTPSVSVTGPSVSTSSEGASVTAPSVAVSTPGTSSGGGSQPPAGGGAPPAAGGGDPPPAAGGGAAHVSQPSAAVSGSTNAASTAANASVPAASTTAATATPRGRSRAVLPAASARHGAHQHAPRASVAGARRGRDAARAADPQRAAPKVSSAKHARTSAHAPGGLLDKLGGRIPLPIPVPNWSKPIILALLALALAFGVRSHLSRLRVRRLERQRVTMQRDLDAMQAALVPGVPGEIEGLAVSVAYRPAEGPAAGGDFYDVFAVAQGKVAIILGDVAGHGHGALQQAALTRYTLRAYLQAELEPRAALALAGRALAHPSGENFATVAAALYDAHAGRLTYACAGHPPPILLGPQAHEPLTLCACPPVGWKVPTGRRQTVVSLPAGTLACFFSDGLVEARCGKELFGRERLAAALTALGPRATAPQLLREVQRATLATPDDMAACILQASGDAAYARIEELEVDARALDAPATRRFLAACDAAPGEIAHALELAHEMVGQHGSALLRVELGAIGTTIEVLAPGAGHGATASSASPPALAVAVG